jgi:hypothetical protein
MDRFLICAAYWICASKFHSGQWSRGYAKLSQLSRIGYNPGRAAWANEKGSDERIAARRNCFGAGGEKSDWSGDMSARPTREDPRLKRIAPKRINPRGLPMSLFDHIDVFA